MYCDRLYVLAAGAVVADGPPREVVTSAMIRDVYGVVADVAPDPITHRPRVFFRADAGTAT